MSKKSYDVCVAGGGFAGLGAALTAARLGLRTLLIEKDSFWGGTAAVSRHRYLCGLYAGKDPARAHVLNDGLSRELEYVLRQGGRARVKAIGEVLVLEYVLADLQHFFEEQMQRHSGLEIWTGAEITGVLVQERAVSGLEIQMAGSRRVIECQSVIDATGDGSVIALSGVPFSLSSADERQLAAYAVEIEGLAEAPEDAARQAAYVLAQAAAQGELARHLKFSPWQPGPAENTGLLSLSVVPSDGGYELEKIRADARQVHALLQHHLSFFRPSRIKSYGERAAEREGRRLCGEETLTQDDVLTGRKKGGVKCAWPVEFWDVRQGPQYAYLAEGDYYEIPAGCLRSNTLTNLFAAGRCLSADARALASARVTAACLAMGEAAAQAVSKMLRESGGGSATAELSGGNIVSRIEQETQGFLDRPAIRQGKRQLTYQKLFEEVRRLQAVLALKPFARTGLFLTEGPDTIALSLAVLACGAVVVPVPPESAPEEVRHLIETLALDALIFEQTLYSGGAQKDFTAGLEKRRCGLMTFTVQWPHQKEFESLNPAFIRFTSGTTGASKGVVLSHETIDERTRAADRGLKMSAEDRVLWVLPMTWHFVVTILLFLRRGAEILLARQGLPAGLAEGLSSQPTLIYAAPLHYQTMISSADIKPEALAAVRLAVSTTAPLSAETRAAFKQKFGYGLTNAYGIIEAGLPFIHLLSEKDADGCTGKPLPDYACRVAVSGHVELWGPGFFDAYFSPWRPARDVLNKGWFRTGDLGRWDAEGNLILLGRETQVLNFMGMKIFTREVEEVLERYASIDKAHVFGRAHAVYGQMPCAKLVLKAGAVLQEEDLRVFCYKQLPSYKVPKTFEQVASLQTTQSGKVKLQQ